MADPGNHACLGRTLYGQGHFREASREFHAAVEKRPEDVGALCDLGISLLAAGSVDEAVGWLKRAVEMEPCDAGLWETLAAAWAAKSRGTEALNCYGRSIELDPARVSTWLKLGNHLLDMGHPTDAKACFEQVIRIQPESLDAHVGQARVLERLGRLEEAMETLKCIATHAEGSHNYALLFASICRASKRPDLGIELLERQLTRKNSPQVRCMLLHALAWLLEQQGRYASAFLAVHEANSLRGAVFDVVEWRKYVDGIIGQETTGSSAGFDSEVPVFIVGLPRSGTSLTEQILDRHPDFVGAGEIDEVGLMLGDALPGSPEALEAGRKYLAKLNELGGGASLVCNKLPHNFKHLGLIAQLFPRARIIHCTRDLLDVGLSCYFQNFSVADGWSTRLDWIGHFSRGYDRLMNHWKANLSLEILEVDYDDLVSDTETQVRRMLDFCGLPWEPSCLSPHKSSRVVHTASNHQVRKPIYTSSVKKSTHYAPWLGPLRLVLGNLVDSDESESQKIA